MLTDNDNSIKQLLYLSQKRHFANFGEWLFNEDFEGWVHGPVNKKVRTSYVYLDSYNEEINPEEDYSIREIVFEYGKFSS